MFKLTYLVVSFFILQTLAINANAYCTDEIFNRQLIKQEKSGYYLVQDFYEKGQKLTDPYTIKEQKEAEKKKFKLSPCIKPDFITIHGSYTSYYHSGLKRIEGHYDSGKRYGVWTAWSETGVEQYQVTYKDLNKPIGEVVYKFVGGETAKGQQSYLYGLDRGDYKVYRVGTWQFFDKNKQLIKEGSYSDQGLPTGIWYTVCHGQRVSKIDFTGMTLSEMIDQYPLFKTARLLLPKEELKAKHCYISPNH